MDFEILRKERNVKNEFAKRNGMQITEVSEGYAKVMMEVGPEHLNPIHAVHGGCIFTLADAATGAAAASFGESATTVDANIHYLRAGLNCTAVYAEAKVIKRGKKVIVLEANVKDQRGKLLATGIFTYMVIQI